MEVTRRKRLGAWYTPPELVVEVCRQALPHVRRDQIVTVLDPACGDGRFLVAAAERIAAAGGRPQLVGVDIDAPAVESARAALAGWDAEVTHGDALAMPWTERRFDAIVGNPPFLSQMAAGTTRGGRSAWGGGPYADAAVEFLALAMNAVRPDGGSVGLVLPQSVLASRDAAEVRAAVAAAGALRWVWWSRRSVFDAQVLTCAVVIEAGRQQGTDVVLSEGLAFVERVVTGDGDVSAGDWSRLLATAIGVPAIPTALASDGVIGDRATAHLDFRDEYYGLIPAVFDDSDGPPLITSGLIDPGRCAWGARPVRFAKHVHRAPRVALDALAPAVHSWALRRLVPKVLVASQTRIVEAVADEAGEWLPSVPVLTVVPVPPADLWEIAAVLTSPIASAFVAQRSAGSALSASALRVTPAQLAAIPWPAGEVRAAVDALRAGDIATCGRLVTAAYAVDVARGADLVAWWSARLVGDERSAVPGSGG